jgi:hypothetical protein
MNQRELDALEKCIALTKAGIPIEECINQIKDPSPEVIEILKATRELISLGENQASDELMKRSLSKLLSQAAGLKAEENQATPKRMPNSLGAKIREQLQGGASLRPVMSRITLVVGITAMLILVSGGLVITSAKSLPGDSLYPVKIAVEDITVYLVPSNETKQQYEQNYSQQRVDEVNRLIALNRTQQISFEGILEEKSLSNWIVSGIPITIQAKTTFVGELKGTESFVTGSVVEVEGNTNPQGGVIAHEVHLRQYQFTGIVEKIDKNSWQISGTKLSITPRTQIEQGIIVGDAVTVVIRSDDSGLYALSIQSAATPVPPQSMEPTESSVLTVIEDPIEHRGIDSPEAIMSIDVESTIESYPSSHEQVQETPEPSQGAEHKGNSTIEATDSHTPEAHKAEHTTSEHHETPEPTHASEGSP